jgi:hypothetical protein
MQVELALWVEGSLHDEGIVEIRLSNILDHHVNIDRNGLLDILMVNFSESKLRFDIGLQIVNEVS